MTISLRMGLLVLAAPFVLALPAVAEITSCSVEKNQKERCINFRGEGWTEEQKADFCEKLARGKALASTSEDPCDAGRWAAVCVVDDGRHRRGSERFDHRMDAEVCGKAGGRVRVVKKRKKTDETS